MHTDFEKIVAELMKMERLGICSLCGEHSKKLFLRTFNLDDRYFAGWVCEQCADAIDTTREVVSG